MNDQLGGPVAAHGVVEVRPYREGHGVRGGSREGGRRGFPAQDEQWTAAHGSRPWHYQERVRPTHFVAVRLVSREIQRRVQQLQQWFVAKDPLFERCLVPLKRLHSALLLTSFDESRLQEAQAACADAGCRIREFLSGEPVNLVVRGIGHFGGRVLFARVRTEPPNLLEAVHHLLSRSFMRHGFPVLDETGQAWLEKGEDPHPFEGHASFLKVSKALAHARSEEERRALRVLRISVDDYASCKNTSFGSQLCPEFEMLGMLGMASDGYYTRLQLEPFQDLPAEPAQGGQAPAATCSSSSGSADCTTQGALELALEGAWAEVPGAASLDGHDGSSGEAGGGAKSAPSGAEDSAAGPCKRRRVLPGGGGGGAGTGGQKQSLGVMSPDVWSMAQRTLVLRDLMCLALVARDGLALLQSSISCVQVVLFSVGAGRASSWDGSCADWDRRASDDGDWPLELRFHDAFLFQQASSTIAVEIGFAEDAQDCLFGNGIEHLHAALRQAMPKCLGTAMRIEIDAIRNISTVSEASLQTLLKVQPRILGIEGLAADEMDGWCACLAEMAGSRVFVHAWTDSDITDAGAFFAQLLKSLPPGARALDFQNLAFPLLEVPVGLLPGSCGAFGTLVLQRDVNGCSARGSMAFCDFASSFPTFPSRVAVVRASLGTEGRWAQSPRAMAEVFRAKFPGLAVLQLELSLKASASVDDVPFVELASALLGMGVRVEVTNICCRAVQYEFLRAALDNVGAVVHQLEDERPSAFPFSHPRYCWAECPAEGQRQ